VRTANVGIDTCRGLVAAHANGLVHRDLKPENLLLSVGDDGREIVKIADFGVAKSLGVGSTRRGTLVGTVRYMAPEQVGLDSPVGPATDVYALGVILYECLKGKVPFDEETTERTLYRIMTDAPEPLGRCCPDLPRGLAETIDRALERDPGARYPNAHAFAEALTQFAGARRAQESGGRIVTGIRATPSGDDTLPGSDEPPAVVAPAPRAVETSSRRSRRPAAWLLVVLSAGAALGLIRLFAPAQAAQGAAPGATALTALGSAEGSAVRYSTAADRKEGISESGAVAGAPASAIAVVESVPTHPPAGLSSVRAVRARPPPRSAPRPAREEPAQRGQPPPLSFDPRNPYGP
jgi:serine/threonine-protein kinase